MWNRPDQDWTLSIRSCSSHPGHFSDFPTALEHSEPAVAPASSLLPCQASQVIGPGLHNEWETSPASEGSWSLALGAQQASPSSSSQAPGGLQGRHGIWAGRSPPSHWDGCFCLLLKHRADREWSKQTNDWTVTATKNLQLTLSSDTWLLWKQGTNKLNLQLVHYEHN